MNAKRTILIQLAMLLTFALSATAQSPDLDKVLKAMDQQAASFKNAKADFDQDQYTKVVNEHDHDKGTTYFRREGKNSVEMAVDLRNEVTQQVNGKPVTKLVPKQYVVFKGGLVQVYNIGADQVTEYNAGKKKDDFESFLVLGFGGSGQDLKKQFDVKYGGMENVASVNAAKLVLTPKSERVKNMFATIILWIDPAKGVSVQQQFITADGDYRLEKYSNIVLNGNLSDNVFKLKTTGKTSIVRPQG
jgi:outer membrane lipoprotein-sorting protein